MTNFLHGSGANSVFYSCPVVRIVVDLFVLLGTRHGRSSWEGEHGKRSMELREKGGLVAHTPGLVG